MTNLVLRRGLREQTLMWEEINWMSRLDGNTWKPLAVPNPLPPARPALNSPQSVTGRPPGTDSGQPYWQFTWQLTNDSGIRLTDLVVCDTQGPGSTEPVCKLIDFTDFKLAFHNTPAGSLVDFDMAAGFKHTDSRFAFDRNGSRYHVRPMDTLFQYGLYLKLINDFSGTRVTLVIAVVLRGAANDFDPGGVPVALKIYPQIGWKWENTNASGPRVRQFRGSVRVTVNNYMTSSTHVGHVRENVASFFADSNTSMSNIDRAVLLGYQATGGYIRGSMFGGSYPFGWGMTFDYNRLNVTTEQEYPAVYGPSDERLYLSDRSRKYWWPSGLLDSGTTLRVGGFAVTKLDRQGYYDNIHIHANMGNDLRTNLQIHAPFCGHSCVHMHWRWSNVSSNGAGNLGWQFKGWSTGATIQAHSLHGAPLIPPNQKLTVALCNPSRRRESNDQILPVDGRMPLDRLQKMIWYCTDIFDHIDTEHQHPIRLNAGEQQVIMEHGLGWAYRYSTPDENRAVRDLMLLVSLRPPWDGEPTQQQMSDFFQNSVYPLFRYYDKGGILVNQVPEGDWSDVESGGTSVKMEQL